MSVSRLNSVWDDHLDFPPQDWKTEVENNDSRLGYFNWVESQLNADELTDREDKEHWRPESHWDDHDEYPVEGWKLEVENGDTRGSYIGWVNSQISMRLEEDAADREDELSGPKV